MTDFPVSHRQPNPKPQYRKIMKLVRKAKGPALVRHFNRASGFLGLGVTLSYLDDLGLYLATDKFGSHAFSHPKRIWTIWEGLEYRGASLGRDYFADHIDFQDDDWIVDVGANTGDLSLFFKGQGASVNLISFEPAPAEYKAMSYNLEHATHLKSQQAHQTAAWNESAQNVEFHLMSAHGDSSLIPLADATETVKVPTARLDEVLEDRPYKCLKLEAEGAEPEILEGAAGILHRFDYITVDCGFERGLRKQSTLPEVANYLIANGFEICGFNGSRYTVLFRRKDVAA